MNVAKRVVVHAACHLGIPVIDGSEDYKDGRNAHHHVEVGDYKIGVGQRHVDDHISEEEAGQSAEDKSQDERNREQHRHIEMDIALPQGQDPVIDLDGRGYRNDQGCGGKEEAEIGVHAADIHVVRPDNEADRADEDNCPDHHAIAEDVLTGMC